MLIFSLLVLSRRNRIPAVTVAWILSFILLPYLGVILFILVGFRKMRREKRRKPIPSGKMSIIDQSGSGKPSDSQILSSDLLHIARLGERLTGFPVSPGNRLTLYEEALATYTAIAEAMSHSTKYIHMEYYIFQADETGKEFRDLLIHQARKGVTCRLLVDYIGSFYLNQSFADPMIDAGVQFAYFWPVKLSRPWGWHLRNHRKLVIVDGRIGFIGSQNIGDEYVNWKNRRLSWRDTHIKIEGPGVDQLQAIFHEDWEFTTGEAMEIILNTPLKPTKGISDIQTLPTGPDESQATLEIILTSLIYAAKKRITIVTPYFIPTVPIALALDTAVKRGVKVDILVPEKSNHWIVGWVARGWYRDILISDVNLYEYAETFVHAKLVTIDSQISLIGSANMDERSFRLNFECTTLVYDSKITEKLLRSFDSMKMNSRKMTLAEFKQQRLWNNVRDGAFRILSPLL